MLGLSLGLSGGGQATAWVARAAGGARALIDADFVGKRYWFNGQSYATETAWLTAIGGAKSGITRTVGPYTAPAAIELVTNGDFSGGTTGWTAQNGSTIAVVSGELQATGNGTSGTASASQGVPCALGRAYSLSGQIRRVTNAAGFNPFLTASSVASLFGGESSTIAINSTTATAVSAIFGAVATTMYVGMQTTNSPTGSSGMDNISVKETRPSVGWGSGQVSAYIDAITGPGHAALEVLWQADADGERNRLRVYRDVDQHVYFLVTTGNAVQALIDLGLVGDSTRFKVAVSATVNAFLGKLEGGAVISDAVGSMPGVAVMRVGRSFTGDTWQGDVYRVSTYATAATVGGLNALLGIPAGMVDYGTPRGTWNTGLLANSLAPAFLAEDLVYYAGQWFFCVLGFTASGASATPDADAAHWQLLPNPLRVETTIGSDDFETGAGPFATGRTTPEGVAWHVTGAGFASAVIGSGYATSTVNTYFVLKNLPRLPTRWTASELDNTAAPLFTMSIGVGLDASVNHQLHTNFSPGGVGFTWFNSGQTGQSFTNQRYGRSSNTGIAQNVASDIEVRVRGTFAFAYSGGAICGILCDDSVPDLVGAADSVYTQIHDGPPLGDQRVFSVAVKG